VCFEQALTAVQQLPAGRERHAHAIDVRFSLRNALVPFGQGEHDRIRRFLEEAETLAQALHDRHRLGWAAVHMIHYFWFIGDCQHAVAVGQRALTMTKTLGDVPLQVVTNLHLGRSYLALGDYGRAMGLFSHNVQLLAGDVNCERVGEVLQTGLPALPSVQSRTWLAWCLAEQGALTDGLACSAEGLRIAEATARPFSRVEAYRGMSHVHLRRGEWSQAVLWLELALDICRGWEIPVPLQPLTAALCYAYALSGQGDAALPLLEQTASTGAMAPRWRGLSQVWLSEASLRLGRRQDALELAARALEFLQAHGYQGEQAWALWLRGAIAAHGHPPEVEEAHTHYRQALALAEALGMRPLQAHCHRGLGTVYAAIGQRQQAHTALTTALEFYRAMEMAFWLPETEAALAQVEGR
jgi:tetratricopeptide (TPR) repeat protein